MAKRPDGPRAGSKRASKDQPPSETAVWICCPFITVKGKKVYPKKAKVFCFWVEPKGDRQPQLDLQ